MQATVYVVRNSLSPDNAVDYVLDTITGYDSELYRRNIEVDGLDTVTHEEWSYWTTHGTYQQFDNRNDAEAFANSEGMHVIEITRDDLRAALLRFVTID